jgi:hypothetical protein
MRRLEASPSDGLWTLQVIEYVNTQLLSGLVYSAIVKMINGYTWDTDTTNKNISLLGFNSNLLDVFIPGNGISVLANNSGGKIETGISGLTGSESTALLLIGELEEADHFFDESAGLLHYYRKGTTTDLITPKTVVGQTSPDDVTITE